MALTNCRHFNGYKPCGRNDVCDESCPHHDKMDGASILIIHLGAQGAVVRSTCLLPAIKRKFPRSQVTWVTDAPMDRVLQGHPSIDRVLTSSIEGQTELKALHFDVGFVIDKSLRASGILKQTQVDLVFGFVADSRTGAIVPATPAADELWQLGLSDELKFKMNQKTENQLVTEALELGPYQRDEYSLSFTPTELAKIRQRQMEWRRDPRQAIIGFNTGCGPLMPAKKWTVEFHREVIARLLELGFSNLVLLGGPNETERNQAIAKNMNVIQSPTQAGIRDGMMSIAACDVIVTGDSLALHLAIAFKKFNVAWFGPSCAQEIDLYDRGVKLQAEVECGPCWKRVCDKAIMCYDRVPIERILSAIRGFTDEFSARQTDPRCADRLSR